MIDLPTQRRFQELFRRENRSFLQYVAQASPWAGPADHELVDKVQQLAAEERDALSALAESMEAMHFSLPYLGAFPTAFTNFNFIAIRKLMKPLVAEQRKELLDLEADAQSLTAGKAQEAIEKLVELNRKHLRDFEQMTGINE
jgi:tRNA isopentenyl-2-thiomethyl-A-37 hydroxylase MiaE